MIARPTVVPSAFATQQLSGSAVHEMHRAASEAHDRGVRVFHVRSLGRRAWNPVLHVRAGPGHLKTTLRSMNRRCTSTRLGRAR